MHTALTRYDSIDEVEEFFLRDVFQHDGFSLLTASIFPLYHMFFYAKKGLYTVQVYKPWNFYELFIDRMNYCWYNKYVFVAFKWVSFTRSVIPQKTSPNVCEVETTTIVYLFLQINATGKA